MKVNPMQLTLINRLRLCCEILTAKSGHGHPASEKRLSTFTRGYSCGYTDGLIDGRIRQKEQASAYVPPPPNQNEKFCDECGGFVIGVHPDDWIKSQQCSCKEPANEG